MTRFTSLKYLLTLALMLSFAIISRADTIKLKDGRTIKCDSAREDGKVVRYWIGEAALTVPLERVERIDRDNDKGDAIGTDNSTAATPSKESGSARLAQLQLPAMASNNLPAGSRVSVDALDKLEMNVKAEPNNTEQRIMLVNALKSTAFTEYQGGHYAEAKALLQRALSWREKDADSLLGLVSIELSEGRYSDAAEYANRAVEADAKNQQAYYQLGAAYYALERLPEAVKSWQSALKLGDNPYIRAALEKAQRELEVAADFTNGRTRFFNISMEGGSPDPAMESALLGLLEESFGQLKRRFNYQPTEKISAIFYTRDTFSNITRAPSWAGAVNDGKLRVPIGGLSGVNNELASTVTHELTHSFVFFKARGKCPTWLNEGLAQMMEGRSASTYRSRLARLASEGGLPPLQLLSGTFMNFSTAQAEVAYAYSLFATEMLAERGVNSAIDVLEDLGQNYNISVALSRHTRFQNIDAFEQELKRRLAE